MPHQVEIVNAPAITVAVVRFRIRSAELPRIGEQIGRAFGTGLLIAVIGSLCYVATWEVLYYRFMPDFYAKYAQSTVDKARTSGRSDAEVAQIKTAMDAMVKSADNPAWVAAMTFVEPFPVGFVIALISAGVLRRKRGTGEAVLATT